MKKNTRGFLGWKVFILLIALISFSIVFAQSITVSNPLTGENITAGDSFNINWTSTGVSHFQIIYTTNANADCNVVDGGVCSTGDWVCLQNHPYGNSGTTSLTTSAPFVNSTSIKIRVEGHSGGHATLTNACSDVFTIASIPSTPTNLISSVINTTSINLSWDSELSNELVSKYLIFRDSTNIANTPDNNSLNYLDTGLNPSLYYNYTIKKINPVGESPFSNSVNASTSSLDTTPPASIGNLTALEVGDNHIFWNWTNPNDLDFNHTQIYRNGVFLSDVFSPNNSYNMTGLATNTPYTISIRTVDNSSNVNSTFVNSTSTTTGSSGGDPDPGGGGGGESVSLSSPNGGETWIQSSSHDITWSSSNIDHFEIYYSTNSGSSWILLKEHPYGSSSTTSYSWTLPSSTSSTLKVRVDGHDENHAVKATDSSNSDFSISSAPPPETGGTSTGGGGGGGGGSGSAEATEITPTIWTKTYDEGDIELSEKVSVAKTLGEKEKVNIKIDGQTHSVGVVELTETTALIEVSSTPQQASLTVGEEKMFEVTNDSYYDILVRLNSIINRTADVSISFIHIEILGPEQLFDITFTLGDSIIQGIRELSSTVTFESFGLVPTFVNLTFTILDEAGKEIYLEKSSLTVTTVEVLRWDYGTLSYLPKGKYTAVLTTLYNVNVSDEFRVSFELDGEKNGISLGLGIVILVFFLVILAVWWFIVKIKKVIRRMEKRTKRLKKGGENEKNLQKM